MNDKYKQLVDNYLSIRKSYRLDEKNGEKYKWELITKCAGKSLLEQAKYWKTSNLYDIQRNKSVIDDLMANRPNELEQILQALVDESIDLDERLANFKSSMSAVAPADKSSKANDERTASLILCCRYPQKYPFYKDSIYQGLCKCLGVETKQAGLKYSHFIELITPLVSLVETEQEAINSILGDVFADTISSNVLLAQDICWVIFEQYLSLYRAAIIRKINEADDDLICTYRIKSNDEFVWVGTKNGLIGNLECHYEVCWTTTTKRGNSKHDGTKIFIEVHFEKNSSFDEEYRRLFENDDRIKKFIWSHRINGLRLNDEGYRFIDYTLEGLVEKTYAELKQLHQIIYPEINKIKTTQMANELINKYKDFLLHNHNMIFTGAPGTGKTYLAKQIAASMIGESDLDKLKDNSHFGFVQFHPSYDYTDFVEGMRPSDEKDKDFEYKQGTFKQFCARALETAFSGNFEETYMRMLEDIGENIKEVTTSVGAKFGISVNRNGNLRLHTGSDFQINGVLTKDALKSTANQQPSYWYWKGYYEGVIALMKKEYGLSIVIEDNSKPYVFVIDEINRGEISKIFGELFYAIDPGYRGVKGKVDTQYQNLIEEGDVFKNGFYVPDNVYVIGTMNDIDRSVESLDFAFRRRFASVEITVDDTLNDILASLDSDKINIAKKHLVNLNNEISKDEALGDEFCIGGSYMLKLKEVAYDYDALWKFYIKNVLKEYLRGLDKSDIKSKLDTFKKAFLASSDDETAD